MTQPIQCLMRKCPSCVYVFLEDDTKNGIFNNETGMTWTDGRGDIDLKIEENIHQCKKCLSIFYIKDVEIVGIDNVDDIDGSFRVDRLYACLNIPSINGFIGRVIKHGKFDRYYIPLKGMPPSFRGFSDSSDFMSFMNDIDYYRAINIKLFSSLEMELDLRINAWWNDRLNNSEAFRLASIKSFSQCNEEDRKVLRNFELSEESKSNINRMLDIYDSSSKYGVDHLPYKIMKSDMLRRLGLFDECTNFLKNNTEQKDLDSVGYKEAIETIFVSCKEKIRCARRTGFEKPWNGGPVFYI